MTLGEKLRKYRLLRGMKQRELGEAVGFKPSTADVRINQYESGKMEPKADIREALAVALGVDVSAISDINVASWEDVMQVLFEFEDAFGMRVEKRDGTTSLVFSDDNRDIITLISYLNLWRNKRLAMSVDDPNVSEETLRDYSLWKGSFKSNIDAYYEAKEREIEKKYAAGIQSLSKKLKHAEKTSEITILLRSVIDAGISVGTAYLPGGTGEGACGFTFAVNDLLNPPSAEAEELVTKFLCEYKYFEQLGARCFSDIQIPGNSLMITYYVAIPSFIVITSQISDYAKHKAMEGDVGDGLRDLYEMHFKDELDSTYCNIKDEIMARSAAGK